MILIIQHESLGGSKVDVVPLLSVVVPAYNAADHLDRALVGLAHIEGIEIVIVDDGSTDSTGEIADGWARRHPQRIRVLHQRNVGHGGAINAGIGVVRGEFIKVLDADDWLNVPSLQILLDSLSVVGDDVDVIFTDFVHERIGKPAKVARFDSVFPQGGVFEWKDTTRFTRRQVLMMHAIVYRTRLLKECGLRLPESTFYVDSLYVVVPLVHVRHMRYLPIPLYRYFIGRQGQSVATESMIARVEEQLQVNRFALAALPSDAAVGQGTVPVELQRALLHYVEGLCAVTSATLACAGSPRHLALRDNFWRELRSQDPRLYSRMRRGVIGTTSNLPGPAGRRATGIAYRFARHIVGFS